MKKVLFWISNFMFFVIAGSYLTMIPVRAYIDPSAVTYVIQAVAGVVIAIGACLTIFRHKIAEFFRKNKEVEKREVHFVDEEDDQDTENEEVTQ